MLLCESRRSNGVKGESLDAVLYLADKEHVKALVNGTGTELGRIGYVALTRARNLFWLGLLKADAETYRTALTSILSWSVNMMRNLTCPWPRQSESYL
jgi:hypothetical protein